jgi:DNA polymerase epsilon subunit 1
MENQQILIKKRVKALSQKIYKQIHVSKTEIKENTVCMRENSFYVDTVRAFRDRRYEFKNLVKVWKNKMEEAEGQGNLGLAQECLDNMTLYESLQV